ncbi:phosphoribosylformylglycinamidine synthase subunit PurL [Acanthopleuribacter pedis]|uniref:Phosphoribosylformylglycinamidine synthase subunit PurL n=1 Tax=Acanthopleuribacter pedis TaxID=442870 RepID=A0A8J7U286_9BACT|nr:phosphoribosylformylglycinamidine synthase subunit PurL [Acanthopleuribacter pedis]MBO1317008.1 phosphoribosylformylglycinamidine synthase subunit PurL [Acanthopleuribacter pedis]
MKEPVVTVALAKEHGLTEAEFDKACAILGRTPSFTELGIFSAMWSEHCSYKSSKIHLKKLPTTGKQVVIGPGENAGAVDLGDGLCAVFKMESHNHPSFIEPYQGAATGVGGILRDVFTMGARPVANMNALRFGDIGEAHMRYLVKGVTKGIGDYGNCMGIPTVGGEVFFDPAYQNNILVNAMTVGLVERDAIFLGEASGVGNVAVYVGAKTGRDGIHGASMASEEFNEDSEKKRPTVQVGDPFTEKLLLEALMELYPTGAVIGIQDMGAAGLTSSSFEMAGRAGSGIEFDLGKVPTREEGMTAYEIMLSESQERMLLVCQPERVDEVKRIFEKWDLSAAVIGTVTDSGRVRIKSPQGEWVVDMPVGPLADEAPQYDRPYSEHPMVAEYRAFDTTPYRELSDANGVLRQLLACPNIASKKWFYRQYDHTVQTNTVQGPDAAEAAVVRIKDTDKAIAVTADCNPRFVQLDPHLGTAHAVAEAARNISCTGGKPLAITDCLNFGNPENPHIMWQFKTSLDGMGEACRALDTPVISGNVSLYNETNGKAIFPTPSVGMVGLLNKRRHHAVNSFHKSGLHVFVLGETAEELGGSEYLATVHGVTNGALPALDLAFEAKLNQFLQDAVAKSVVKVARDCSLGGLAVALAKCTFGHGVGLKAVLQSTCSPAATLFGESAGRVVVAVEAKQADTLVNAAADQGIACSFLGESGGETFSITLNETEMVGGDVAELADLWQNGLERVLN